MLHREGGAGLSYVGNTLGLTSGGTLRVALQLTRPEAAPCSVWVAQMTLDLCYAMLYLVLGLMRVDRIAGCQLVQDTGK